MEVGSMDGWGINNSAACRPTGFLRTLNLVCPCVEESGRRRLGGVGKGQLLLVLPGGVLEGTVDGVGTLVTCGSAVKRRTGY